MASDDRFKKYQEAGADFLEAARTRAEEFLRELARAGETTQKQGRGAVDEVVEGGRRGTEQLIASIRREITAQLSQLGLATKDDLRSLEERLSGRAGGPAAKAGGTKKAGAKTPGKKAAAKKVPVAGEAPPRKARGPRKDQGPS